MRAEGADLVDVGGESTRPGADRVDAATETARVVPVIRELAARGRADEHRHHPGRGGRGRAWRPARRVVNDVSGGLADPRHGRGGGGGRLPVGADALARALPADAAIWPTTTTW